MVARTLVLGLGNPLLSDDGVGIAVARTLQPRVAGRADVTVEEEYHGGLRLMERMVGYTRVILIDAIQTGAPPGTLHCLGPDTIPTQHSASPHDVNLPTALALGRTAGAALPPDDQVLVLGIEAAVVLDFGEQLSPPVQQALPAAVEAALERLERGAHADAGARPPTA